MALGIPEFFVANDMHHLHSLVVMFLTHGMTREPLLHSRKFLAFGTFNTLATDNSLFKSLLLVDLIIPSPHIVLVSHDT